MPLALSRAVAPSEEPVSLTEAKAQARVEVADDDTLIGGLITAARELVEEQTWRALVTQRWDLFFDAWPATDTVELPRPPLRSVVEVEYTDQAGVATVWASSNYVVDAVSEPGRLRLKASASWPNVTLREVNGLRIRFEAGYGAATATPKIYKQAILLTVAHWYENREAIIVSGAIPKEIPLGVARLLTIDHGRRF